MDRAAHRHPRAPHRRATAKLTVRSGDRTRRARRSPPPASTPQSIDLIVLATSTPDNTFPATRGARCRPGSASPTARPSTCRRCARASSTRLPSPTACCKTGAYKRALVIGAETFSRILDWKDRTTCVLFGDGAGAVVLEAQQQPGTRDDRGILTTHLRSDGRHKAKLYVDGGPSSTQTVGHLRMEGRAVFKHAVAMITDVIEDAFEATGYTRRRHRLVRAAPGQQAHHRRFRAQARHRPRKGGHHRRPARQHVGGLDPAGADVAVARRAHQARRPGAAGSDGRRLHLGGGAGALVSPIATLARDGRSATFDS